MSEREIYYQLFKPEIPNLADVVTVSVGGQEVGTISSIFLSVGIIRCTGYMFQSQDKNYYGYLHAMPRPDINHQSLNELELFKGGYTKPINCQSNVPKKDLENHFRNQLGIEVLEPITINSPDSFGTLFIPQQNTVKVVIPSQKVMKSYQVF